MHSPAHNERTPSIFCRATGLTSVAVLAGFFAVLFADLAIGLFIPPWELHPPDRQTEGQLLTEGLLGMFVAAFIALTTMGTGGVVGGIVGGIVARALYQKPPWRALQFNVSVAFGIARSVAGMCLAVIPLFRIDGRWFVVSGAAQVAVWALFWMISQVVCDWGGWDRD